MSETQTPSSPASEPAGGSSSSNNQSKEKVVIKAGGSGGYSMDDFKKAVGLDTENHDIPDEPEQEEGRGELLDDPVEATQDPIVQDIPTEEEVSEEQEEEQEEDSEETTLQELQELGKGIKKGGVKAFTKDGKPLTLPPDLEIEQMVDGEVRKINLREHLNVVAGELTVDERLKRVTEFRRELESERQHIVGAHNKFIQDVNTIVNFAKQGNPDLAICYLAEMNGTSPVEMKRQFLKTLVQEGSKFEGKTELEIENYYLNLERQWRDKKEQKQKEQSEKKIKANSFVEYVTTELKKEGLSPDEFTAASQELGSNGNLQGLSQERAVESIIEHALYTKHINMAKSAIELVDPKLIQNKKLFDLLLEHTHPNKFTVEEMADVLSTYLGKTQTRIASALSKKVKPQQVQTKSEKQNGAGKKKIYRSMGDLQKAFGL